MSEITSANRKKLENSEKILRGGHIGIIKVKIKGVGDRTVVDTAGRSLRMIATFAYCKLKNIPRFALADFDENYYAVSYGNEITPENQTGEWQLIIEKK